MVSAASPWEKTVVSLGTCTTTFPSPASARKSATRNPVSLTRRSAPFGLPLMTAARRFTRAAAWPLLFAVFAPAARIVYWDKRPVFDDANGVFVCSIRHTRGVEYPSCGGLDFADGGAAMAAQTRR